MSFPEWALSSRGSTNGNQRWFHSLMCLFTVSWDNSAYRLVVKTEAWPRKFFIAIIGMPASSIWDAEVCLMECGEYRSKNSAGCCSLASFTYFLKIISTQEIVMCSCVWLEKICLSKLFEIPRRERYCFRRLPHGFAMLIRLILLPLPVMVSFVISFWNCASRTVKSQTSCALAPLAYIKLSSVLSRKPIEVSQSGNRNKMATSSKEKMVRGFISCFLTLTFLACFKSSRQTAKNWNQACYFDEIYIKCIVNQIIT